MFDTLRVTQAVIDAALNVSPGARSVAVKLESPGVADFATITLTGSDGWWQPWTASHKANWLGISNPTGSGSSTLNWSRNPSGLAPGVYVDTISVGVPSINASARIFDTLRISAVPVTIAVSPIAHSVVLQQGWVPPADFASVTLSGTAAPATAWSTVHRGSWLNLTSSSGTGSGTVAWTRNVAALAAGTYVDTIVVSAVGVSSAAMIYDSVRISAAPVPLHIAVAPGGRNTSVQQGQAASGDQAFITLTGTGASTTAWTASNTRAWLSLTNPAGTGSTTLVWTRNASGLNPGVYIDTISVRALGATGWPALVIDTLSITAIPVPLHLVASFRQPRRGGGGGAAASQRPGVRVHHRYQLAERELDGDEPSQLAALTASSRMARPAGVDSRVGPVGGIVCRHHHRRRHRRSGRHGNGHRFAHGTCGCGSAGGRSRSFESRSLDHAGLGGARRQRQRRGDW